MNQSTFGRKRDSRNLLIRNLAASVILYESVTTTQAKARFVQPFIERLITIGKNPDKLTARRQLSTYLPDEKAITKILEELTTRFADQTSGYTRRIGLAPRAGDGAPMTLLQLSKTVRLDQKSAKKEKAAETTKKSEAKAKKA